MPDTELETTSQVDASATDGKAPDTDNATSFEDMSPEELKAEIVKRDEQYANLRSMDSRKDNELGELRKLKDSLDTDNKLANVLSSVKDMVADRDKKPRQTYEELEAEIMLEAQENPAEAMKKFMRTNLGWSEQDKQANEQKYGKVIDELKSQISGLAEVVETNSPDYQDNKDLIEKLRDKGMSIADAKAFAKGIVAEYAPETRQTPPVGIDPTRVVTPEKPAGKPWTDEDVQKWEANGESEEFIAKMKWKRERDANQSEADKENF